MPLLNFAGFFGLFFLNRIIYLFHRSWSNAGAGRLVQMIFWSISFLMFSDGVVGINLESLMSYKRLLKWFQMNAVNSILRPNHGPHPVFAWTYSSFFCTSRTICKRIAMHVRDAAYSVVPYFSDLNELIFPKSVLTGKGWGFILKNRNCCLAINKNKTDYLTFLQGLQKILNFVTRIEVLIVLRGKLIRNTLGRRSTFIISCKSLKRYWELQWSFLLFKRRGQVSVNHISRIWI